MFGSAASARPGACICSSAVSAASSPAPWFAPIAATSSPASRSAASRAPTPGERLGVLVEGQERDDRQRRDAPHGRDRVHELLEVEERLEHEEVGAAVLEHRRLLREELEPLLRARRLAERPDRAADEDVAARQLPRLAGELHRGRVDPLELVVQVVGGELPAVRAERVRLDQLRAGVDEAHVQRDDRLGRPQVRLLGRAQARHRGGQKRPHPAVGDDRRALLQACLETAGHARNLDKPRPAAVK